MLDFKNPSTVEALSKVPIEIRDDLVKAIQQQKQELDKLEATGETGAGMVKITVDCENQIKKVEINCELTEENKQLIESLIPPAHTLASQEMSRMFKDATNQAITKVTQLFDNFQRALNKKSR